MYPYSCLDPPSPPCATCTLVWWQYNMPRDEGRVHILRTARAIDGLDGGVITWGMSHETHSVINTAPCIRITQAGLIGRPTPSAVSRELHPVLDAQIDIHRGRGQEVTWYLAAGNYGNFSPLGHRGHDRKIHYACIIWWYILDVYTFRWLGYR